MKTAIICDIKTLVPFLPSIGITLVAVCAFLTLGGSGLSAVGSVAVIMVLLCMFSLAGYDDQGGWGRFRATMPFSRREVVVGRYLAVLLLGLVGIALAVVLGGAFQALFGALLGTRTDAPGVAELVASSVASLACGLVICAVAMPFSVKFGAMRGMRFFACAVAIVISVGVALGIGAMSPGVLAGIVRWVDENLLMCLAGIVAFSLALYAASCAVSLGIYEKKDL